MLTTKIAREQLKKRDAHLNFMLLPSLASKIDEWKCGNAGEDVARFVRAVEAVAHPEPPTQRLPAAKQLAEAAIAAIHSHNASNGADESNNGEGDIALCILDFLVDLIVSPGSRPLLRPLLATLKALPGRYLDEWHARVASKLSCMACEFCSTTNIHEHTNAATLDDENKVNSTHTAEWLHTAIALLDFPEHAAAVTGAVGPILEAVEQLLSRLLGLDTDDATMKPPTPTGSCCALTASQAEQLQSCLALLHLLIGRYVHCVLRAASTENAHRNEERALGRIGWELMHILLKVTSLPRESMCSVAATLCAASRLPDTSWHVVALHFARGLLLIDRCVDANTLRLSSVGGVGARVDENISVRDSNPVERAFEARGTCLTACLRKLPPLSAVCAVRGMLQSLPLHALTASMECDGEPWALLTDGMLCLLCRATRAVDGKEKQQALQTLSICLDRILQQWGEEKGSKKSASTSSEGCKAKERRVPGVRVGIGTSTQHEIERVKVSDAQRKDVMDALLLVWGDTTPGLAKMAQQCLDTLLIISECQEGGKWDGLSRASEFLRSIALDILHQDPTRKVRYLALTAIIPRLGAKTLLSMRPNLIPELLLATSQVRPVGGAVSMMLGVLWSTLKKECDNGNATASSHWDAEKEFIASWSPHLAAALCSRVDSLRQAACLYALPSLFTIEPTAIDVLLGEIAHAAVDVSVPAFVAVIATGRRCNVMPTAASSQYLQMALQHGITHRLEAMRNDAMQLLCTHPKSLTLPTATELDLVQTSLNLSMRCTSALSRPKILSNLYQLLSRIRAGCAAVLIRPQAFSEEAHADVARCEAFLKKLSAGMVASLHPEVQYGRKYMAIESLCMMLELFGQQLFFLQSPDDHIGCGPSDEANGTPNAETNKREARFLNESPPKQTLAAAHQHQMPGRRKKDVGVYSAPLPPSFQPFFDGFLSKDIVSTLLRAVSDPWDKIREAAGSALLLMPAPLPGLNTEKDVKAVLWAAVLLLRSPRMKDADAGARLVSVVFQQLVLRLGWTVRLMNNAALPGAESQDGSIAADDFGARSANQSSKILVRKPDATMVAVAGSNGRRGRACSTDLDPVLEFLESIVELIETQVAHAERDLVGAAQQSLAHGSLLTLRYALPTVPWTALASKGPEAWRRACDCAARILTVITRLVDVILPILSTPEEMTAVDASDIDPDVRTMLDDVALTTRQSNGDINPQLGPMAQVVTVACWMSAKEAGLTLGTLFQVAPIVQPPSPLPAGGTPLLSLEQQEAAGALLLRVMLQGKHDGAVDKTQTGFVVLLSSLLTSKDAHMTSLPRKWLEEALQHLQRQGQSLRDIVRRSAGLPFAIQGIFRGRAGPGSSAMTDLVTEGISELLRIANDRTGAEPWPRVHAFNVLRMVYADTELSMYTSSFYAQGMEYSILGLVDPQWEVRNAAMLCYTQLLRRVLGFSNVSSRNATGKWSPTAMEFFSTYPGLRPFLLEQLRAAARQLEGHARDTSDEVHPALGPVLTLLLRLRPSLVPGNTRTSDDLPTASSSSKDFLYDDFVPLLQRCGAARSMAVRQRVAKAMPSLVTWQRIPPLVADLANAVASAFVSRSASQADADSRPIWRPNLLHGHLLQLTALLENVAASGTTELVSAVLRGIVPALHRCLSLTNLGSSACCSPLSHELLRVAAWAARLGVKSKDASALTFVEEAAECAWQAALRFDDGHQNTTPVSDVAGSSKGDAMNGNLASMAADPMLPVAVKEAVMLRMLWWPTYTSCVTPRQQQQQQANEIDAETNVLQPPFVELLACALTSESYEVRCAALKCGLRVLQPPPTQGAVIHMLAPADFDCFKNAYLPSRDIPSLCALLEVHLSLEQHLKAMRRTVELLAAALSSGEFSSTIDHAEAARLYDVVLAVATTAADPRTKAAAVSCLGPLLTQSLDGRKSAWHVLENCLDDDHTKEAVLQRTKTMIVVAQECSRSGQPPELREASAELLATSGALKMVPRPHGTPGDAQPRATHGLERMPRKMGSAGASHGGLADGQEVALLAANCDGDTAVELALAAWAVALSLIEDEETETRAIAAGAAAAALDMTTPRDAWAEVVQRAALAGLCERLGRHPLLLRALMTWICDVEAAENEARLFLRQCCSSANGSRSGVTQRGGAVSGKLFEKEADNHHEEPLLLPQLATQALIDVFCTGGTEAEAATSLLFGHMQRVFDAFGVVTWGLNAAESLAKLVQLPEWGSAVGGDCSEELAPKAFPAVHRLCLAATAAGRVYWQIQREGLMKFDEDETPGVEASQISRAILEVKKALYEDARPGLSDQPHVRACMEYAVAAWHGGDADASSAYSWPWSATNFLTKAV